jgi:hypothetical protein
MLNYLGEVGEYAFLDADFLEMTAIRSYRPHFL